MIFNMQSGGVVPDHTIDAQTITPGTADKEIKAGTYLRGTTTVKGDADLIPENIAKGVEIFGVTGNHYEPEYGIIFNSVDDANQPLDVSIKLKNGGNAVAVSTDFSTCNLITVDMDKIAVSTISGLTEFSGKMKIKRATSIATRSFPGIVRTKDTPAKVFLSSNISEISRRAFLDENYQYGGTSATLYCEPESIPDAWDSSFNDVALSSSTYDTLTTIWGVSESAFDAM